MNEIAELVRILAESGNVQSVHIHEGANIYDNNIENLYVGAEPPEAKHHSRLSLFVPDDKIAAFINDLSVCESTADVCRAVAKLSGCKIPNEYKEKTFVKSLFPLLNFDTTETAVYQALYNFS